MRSIRRILVAVKNPDARTSPAVAKAAQLAAAIGAKVELFHAISTPVFMEFELTGNGREHIEHDRHDVSMKKLHALAARTKQRNLTLSSHVEWDYPPHEAIIRRALKIRADLIVAECHAGRHMVPWLLQLTDWELVRHSPVPVLLVKSAKPYSRPQVLATVDPTHAFSKPTRLDDEILEAAVMVKDALKGSLHAMHSYAPLPVGVAPAQLLDEGAVKRLETHSETQARKALDGVVKNFSIPSARRHLIARHPVNAIPELAKKLRSSLVVMGAVSRSGLKSLFIGNTAERVLDDITCDVLVVKPKQFVTKVGKRVRGMHLQVSTPPIP